MDKTIENTGADISLKIRKSMHASNNLPE